jgi:hypothetical protein
MSWINKISNSPFFKKFEKPPQEPPILYDKTQQIIDSITEFYQSDFISYWGANNSSMVQNDVIVFNEILKNK